MATTCTWSSACACLLWDSAGPSRDSEGSFSCRRVYPSSRAKSLSYLCLAACEGERRCRSVVVWIWMETEETCQWVLRGGQILGGIFGHCCIRHSRKLQFISSLEKTLLRSHPSLHPPHLGRWHCCDLATRHWVPLCQLLAFQPGSSSQLLPWPLAFPWRPMQQLSATFSIYTN